MNAGTLVWDLILGLSTILAAFAVLATVFTGIGLAVRRAFDDSPIDVDDLMLAFWVGFAAVLLFLIVWSFARRVDGTALLLVLASGFAALGWQAPRLKSLAWREAAAAHKGSFASAVLGSLWVANQSMAAQTTWDDGLYHLQAVRWAEAYAVVPGIANLHGPLGFNNASFLYDAMVDSGWWLGRGFHIANGLLVWALLLQGVASGAAFFGREPRRRAALFRFLCIVPALYVSRDGQMASYSTDIPAAALFLVSASVFYELLDDGERFSSAAGRFRLMALAVLLSAAVCAKLNTGLFAAMTLPMATWVWWKRVGAAAGSKATLAYVALIPVAFAVPWIMRSIVLSGYPLYPLSFGGFPVEWRVPLEHVQAEYAYIGFTERGFSWRVVGSGWLRLVTLIDLYAVLVPSIVTAISVIGIWRAGRGFWTIAARRPTRWLFIAITVSILGWFISAPSTRYALQLFWALAAGCVCEYYRAMSASSRHPRGLHLALVLLVISPVFVMPVRDAISDGRSIVGTIVAENFVAPGPDRGLHPFAQKVRVRPYTTRSGLVVNVPDEASGSRVCATSWDAPLPCTPNPAPNLELRRPGTLQAGFKVDGSWQMENWPYVWQHEFLREWRSRR